MLETIPQKEFANRELACEPKPQTRCHRTPYAVTATVDGDVNRPPLWRIAASPLTGRTRLPCPFQTNTILKRSPILRPTSLTRSSHCAMRSPPTHKPHLGTQTIICRPRYGNHAGAICTGLTRIINLGRREERWTRQH